MPDPRLEAAYRATDYRAGDITIRIDEIPEIDADSWAFISAGNPGSIPLPDAENAERMAQLEAAVRALNLKFARGEGAPRDGSWPAEPSLLIADIEEATACELGRRFEQAAIVFGRRNEAARLTWL